ncbi:hypothetical protein A8L34_28015 [Bacillus sp. FJAT-27264]|uniref:hypothetical protein n=1 Tax=Paenibacillus sp. (strain DSM 101736 / FJAT-27264) TaxID=1850362 RepID=UPI000807BDAE|nr:hypothetical protein [Bacillus sp. FJAT-27264]OBZ15895.1 hypothetical protein A8L34_28015 [Bacillus sp. FJAT-27264]
MAGATASQGGIPGLAVVRVAVGTTATGPRQKQQYPEGTRGSCLGQDKGVAPFGATDIRQSLLLWFLYVALFVATFMILWIYL